MKSLTGQQKDVLLCEKERGIDGCLFSYRLCVCEEAHARRYTVTVRFSDGDGYATECEHALPFAEGGRARALFDRLVRALVTPIDLPYVLEDLVSV